MQITSHNRPKHLLHRDASLVVMLTVAVLVLSAFLANTCVQLLEAHGYVYLPSSFGEYKAPAGFSSFFITVDTAPRFPSGETRFQDNAENSSQRVFVGISTSETCAASDSSCNNVILQVIRLSRCGVGPWNIFLTEAVF